MRGAASPEGPIMGVGEGTSGASADVPPCRTYTPVGLKLLTRKEKEKGERRKEKKRKKREKEKRKRERSKEG